MKGRYTYRSVPLGVAVIVLFMLFGAIFTPEKMFDHKFIVMPVLFGLMFLSNSLPGSFKADDSGFTIGLLGRQRRFSYDEIADVRYEFIPPAYKKRSYGCLTVITRAQGEVSFCENTGSPDRSKLAGLCTCVKERLYSRSVSPQAMQQAPVSGGLSGEFRCAREKTGIITALTMFALFGPVTGVCIMLNIRWAIPIYGVAYVGIFAILGVGHSCKWSADEYGFMIKEGPFTRRMTYDNIQRADITCKKPFRSSDYRTRVELAVTDMSGRRITYTELSQVSYEELTYSPGTCPKPQLVLLYEHLERVRGSFGR